MARRVTDADVLEAIERLTEVCLVSPTVREVKDALGIRSPSDMHRYLERLREKGLVSWMPRKARTLRVTEGWRDLLEAAA